jgi:hypothetical protein
MYRYPVTNAERVVFASEAATARLFTAQLVFAQQVRSRLGQNQLRYNLGVIGASFRLASSEIGSLCRSAAMLLLLFQFQRWRRRRLDWRRNINSSTHRANPTLEQLRVCLFAKLTV